MYKISLPILLFLFVDVKFLSVIIFRYAYSICVKKFYLKSLYEWTKMIFIAIFIAPVIFYLSLK